MTLAREAIERVVNEVDLRIRMSEVARKDQLDALAMLDRRLTADRALVQELRDLLNTMAQEVPA